MVPLSAVPLLFPHPLAEESAPNHSCQSLSPASQDGKEEKEGALFPERTIPARNAKVRAGKVGGEGTLMKQED